MANGTATAIKTRKNALAMATWDTTLLWYARAVGEMKSRPLTDPTSWRYLAAIHGFTLDPNEDASAVVYWKQWTQKQKLPGKTDQNTFWKRCQHGSWYFLPWHRMYLGYFEQIVGKFIVGLGGPADWALPYWNYNQGKDSGLPAAFYQPNLPDNSPNSLLEPSRNPGRNNGDLFLKPPDVTPSAAFDDHDFAGQTRGGSPGFGGPVTRFEHDGRNHGLLEQQPHDVVHDEVGGVMGDPVTAGYDPIFWLHHANIDRLWQIWLKSDPSNANPSGPAWQQFGFNFHNATGSTSALKPADVLETTVAPFYYQYDDLSLPDGVTPTPTPVSGKAVAIAEQTPKTLMTQDAIPEMVGASSEATPLAGKAKTLSLRLFPMSGPMTRLKAVGTISTRKAFLHVENIRGKGRPSSYDVYLNVPEGAGKFSDQFRVGIIPTFGLEQASAATERHPGNGLHFTFNVTKLVNLLAAGKNWDPETVRVTFVPRRKPAEKSYIEVGRVSLFYV